ncbi:iron-containing redox enzyme family protein [Streptomyces sp. ATMOS53]
MTVSRPSPSPSPSPSPPPSPRPRDQLRLRPPPLPEPRGPLSAAVTALLRGPAPGSPPSPAQSPLSSPADSPVYGDDLQLALYVLYELHYQGFQDVPDSLEWDSALLACRAAIEERFLAALRRDVPLDDGTDHTVTAAQALDALQLEPVGDAPGSVSHFLRDEGSLDQLREYAAVRSLYHLKEADPHAWVLPRLHGRAKAAMVAVEFDEFGGGRAERIHARLFADLMEDLRLDATYGHYVDAAPAEALATVNLMSLFGLHRALRAALVGHFAAVEVTSSPASRRLAEALRRVGAGPAAVRFYAEHVEADAVHEQIVRHDVVGGLLEGEPHLDADVVFGIRATAHLDDRLADRLLGAWHAGATALR